MRKLLLFVTEDYYFVSHRLALGVAAKRAGYDVCVVTRVRLSGDVIQRAGLRLIPFENARSSLNPLREIGTLARLIKLYRSERPDLVHHVAMKPILYGSLAARLSGRPAVINAIAGMGWLFTSGAGAARWLKPLVRRALTQVVRAGIALVQNPDDARMLAEFGVAPSRIRLVPGAGVDLEAFQPTPLPDGPPTVLFPARLLWDKGIREFVAAARILRNRHVCARFVVAGEPDALNPAAVPQDQISAWVREGAVEYLGFVTDMPRLLARAHVICLPSYREGLPKSLIEAAAAGRPIVTTDVPGCRDVVRQGENGVLVPPRDVPALANALERLIADGNLRALMGRNGRVRAEQEFAMDRIIEQTLAIYREVTA